MKQVFKVASQSAPLPYNRQDGTQSAKSNIVLQEVGGQKENSYACVMFGNMAQCKFYPGDIVYASLRFSSREYNQQFYTDVTVQDILKIGIASNTF